MKRAAKATQWAKLTQQFHKTPGLEARGLVFGKACFCGGYLHEWGNRKDGRRCPDHNIKRDAARLNELGKLIGAPDAR